MKQSHADYAVVPYPKLRRALAVTLHSEAVCKVVLKWLE